MVYKYYYNTKEYLPIYIEKQNNAIILPISGKGLWSTLYGYFYNPKQIRFLLKDSIGFDINNELQELPPTVHSPIIGWAYDGHPV